MIAIEYTVEHSSEYLVNFKITEQDGRIKAKLKSVGSMSILLEEVDCLIDFASVASPQVPKARPERITMYFRGYETQYDEITLQATKEVFKRLLVGTRKLINKIYGVDYNTIIQDGDKYIFLV